ncbi:hypothetical protein GYMLUDRAFT_41674 [Collybiopsis luxurians FD-317 M1]|uniref:Uncharacterized protein n=1 Tax=Collybiopsis luxurians FD-317 M1 TaxID=944289 RepID=A0A0D0BFT1_9AGAR|nr:hypothetical protein GYMLUDRAFT_41674 [Collybiopsis luxurians FD-317 M1]
MKDLQQLANVTLDLIPKSCSGPSSNSSPSLMFGIVPGVQFPFAPINTPSSFTSNSSVSSESFASFVSVSTPTPCFGKDPRPTTFTGVVVPDISENFLLSGCNASSLFVQSSDPLGLSATNYPTPTLQSSDLPVTAVATSPPNSSPGLVNGTSTTCVATSLPLKNGTLADSLNATVEPYPVGWTAPTADFDSTSSGSIVSSPAPVIQDASSDSQPPLHPRNCNLVQVSPLLALMIRLRWQPSLLLSFQLPRLWMTLLQRVLFCLLRVRSPGVVEELSVKSRTVSVLGTFSGWFTS